ncbi:MAG: hypothetical protein ABDH32_04910 [Candidatus Caldarchaeales archaeon]
MDGWAHLVLVGAYIVNNAYRSNLIERDVPNLEENLKEERFRDSFIELLLNYVESNYKEASAELNTCIDLIVEGYENGKQQ